ncbi:MAG TPA: hypothetical protein VF668_06580 [Pyrinomonadaceae bacterium]
MRHRAAVFLLLIFCFAGGARAQEGPGLFSRVEKVFQEKEPAWEVERVNRGDAPDPARRSYVFRSEEGQASVDVSVWEKEKDAREAFSATVLSFDERMGRRMEKAAVPKLGDEGHIWTHPGRTAWPMLMFRKGKVNVTVFAPSVEVAKRFAQHVLEQMPAG